MLAADTLCSYGSLAKYKNARRLLPVNSRTLVGASGEYSDLQSISDLLRRNALEDRCTADSLYEEETQSEECAKEVWSYLRAVMYNRRNKMNPLWNDVVVAGFKQNADGTTSDEPFLGVVDKIGTAYEDDILATGFGGLYYASIQEISVIGGRVHFVDRGLVNRNDCCNRADCGAGGSAKCRCAGTGRLFSGCGVLVSGLCVHDCE